MKNNNKLNDYFNVAKNSGADYTQTELQRIVELASQDNIGGFNFTSINNKKRIKIMITLVLTLISGFVGASVWLGSLNSPISVNTIPKKIVSETKINKQVASHKKEVELTSNMIVPQKENVLDIEGITSPMLTKDELTKLGITSISDCGIIILRNGRLRTFYHLSQYNKNHYYNPNHIKTEFDSMRESSSNYADSNNKFSSVFTKSINPTTTTIEASPILVTAMDGKILADELGSKVTDREDDLLKKDAEWLDSHNPDNKPKKIFYLEPKDSAMTNEQIKQMIGDTTNTLLIFRRLTTKEANQIKKSREKRSNNINEYLKLNKLIALKVESDCPNNTVLFWYEPTEEFISQLPERYQSDLRCEFLGETNQSVKLINSTKTEWNSETGCQYSDICRETSGAVLETNVFPNPATERISLKFLLNEPRKCTFSLHDLNGTFLQELSHETTLAKGEHTASFDIREVNAGIYLLSMITDKNERIVQRIIVKK